MRSTTKEARNIQNDVNTQKKVIVLKQWSMRMCSQINPVIDPNIYIDLSRFIIDFRSIFSGVPYGL